jgi:uncharacterized membrane protein YfcA
MHVNFKTIKLIFSILLFIIGSIVIYINPYSLINKFIFSLFVGLSVSVLLYKKNDNTAFHQNIIRDKVFFLFFILVIMFGIVTLLFIFLIDKRIYSDISFILFLVFLIILLFKSILKKRKL